MEEGCVNRTIDRGGGKGGVADRAGRHVVAPDFRAIEIDHGAVVAQQARGKALYRAGVSNRSGEEQSYDWEAQRSIGATGTWKWSNTFDTFTVNSTLTLKQEGEKLPGKVSIERAGESEIKHGRLRAGRISFETERERDGETFTNRFYGRLSGDKILGKMESNIIGQARTNRWEAIRTD